ncbi:MAG TPA: thiazole synthase [Candidatus Edwardsbacteria bacterium]|nr:thiazole synthase [Candidatus Edwardsbacteria bacterium]
MKNIAPLIIAGREITSRLFLGTGKFASPRLMAQALEASGAAVVTVALRRVELGAPHDDLLAAINPQQYLILPNTSGARDAAEAVRIARLAREATGWNWLKLEVTPEPNYLLPDPVETLKAAELLVKDGFVVLPYINADPVLARRLQDAGAAAVMPLGSPIGSGRGIKTADQIRIIIEQATVPVVVDAGLGLPSHVCQALELGADAVLVNTAVAVAGDPAAMARSFKLAVEAALLARQADPMPESGTASASSPLTGFLR